MIVEISSGVKIILVKLANSLLPLLCIGSVVVCLTLCNDCARVYTTLIRGLGIMGASTRTLVAHRESRRQELTDELLPHELLLRVAQGYGIAHQKLVVEYDEDTGLMVERVAVETVYPSFKVRLDAAKQAAPYYAPRLATQTVHVSNADELKEALAEFARMLPV